MLKAKNPRAIKNEYNKIFSKAKIKNSKGNNFINKESLVKE